MGNHYPISREQLVERQNNLCGICRQPLDDISKRKRLSVDHIIPKSKGGTNTEDNLQLVHSKCNHLKGDGSYAVVCCLRCRKTMSDVRFSKHWKLHGK